MRKDAGFEVMDNIRLGFSGNAAVEAVAEKNKAEIGDETLAKEVVIGKSFGFFKEWNINGECVVISVEKI